MLKVKLKVKYGHSDKHCTRSKHCTTWRKGLSPALDSNKQWLVKMDVRSEAQHLCGPREWAREKQAVGLVKFCLKDAYEAFWRRLTAADFKSSSHSEWKGYIWFIPARKTLVNEEDGGNLYNTEEHSLNQENELGRRVCGGWEADLSEQCVLRKALYLGENDRRNCAAHLRESLKVCKRFVCEFSGSL